MEINRPINRRKALKVLGLGMLATCMPTLPACGNTKNEKKIKRLIFYFSATGNSLYVSRQIAGEEGTLLSISQEIHNENPVYEAEEIGFVCPVYYGGLPTVVADFVDRLLLERPASYCYAVPTCAGSPAAAAEMLAKKLHARGVKLHAAFPVTMPENYVLMFRVDDEETCADTLAAAAAQLAEIRKAVDGRAKLGMHVTVRDRLVTAGMYPSYVHGRRTAKFFADDKCVGCGVCAKRCPVGAITMVNGRPKWTAPRCAHCMACLRCNAVQYGSRTKGKLRYVNPILKAHH